MPTQLHFAEDTFTLHLFLERLERLINVVVANENLQANVLSENGRGPDGQKGRFDTPICEGAELTESLSVVHSAGDDFPLF